MEKIVYSKYITIKPIRKSSLSSCRKEVIYTIRNTIEIKNFAEMAPNKCTVNPPCTLPLSAPRNAMKKKIKATKMKNNKLTHKELWDTWEKTSLFNV